jgi:hypothetical protein
MVAALQCRTAQEADTSNLADRCPRHRSVDAVLRCERCARVLWERIEAVGRKFPETDSPRARGY